MAQVDVSINGRNYQIACDDGQEEHLSQLAEYVDKRVKELVAAVGQVGDARLLVMASLLVADELSEAFASLEQEGANRNGNGSPGGPGGSDDVLADAIEAMAERIEGIAARLESP